MPWAPDGIHHESDHGLTVTASVLPGADCRVHVCLAGEIDMAASPVLSEVVGWLTALAPVSVVIDLSRIAFAAATLPNFVAQVRRGVPGDTDMVLWQPTPAAEWVLRITDMDAVINVRLETAGTPAVRV